MKKIRFLHLLALLLPLSIASCNLRTPHTDGGEIVSIALDASTLELKEGETHQFIATINPKNATYKNLIWSVTNESVGSVTQNGYFTAKEEGNCFVTITSDNNKSDYCSITVKKDGVIPETTKKINIVAFNDYHGAIKEEGDQMGLLKFGSFLKTQNDKENTLILSQGDDWQGSIYSNYNHGALINDVYAYAGVDARTIGNHDFDWGLDVLAANKNRTYAGRTVPTLAANVYDYNFQTKKVGNTQQSQLGDKTITYTLENGLKVGIVGVIGEDQITSIMSLYTETIAFKNHIDIIKEEATRLREEGCDIVIASIHSGQASVMNHDVDKYVDLVLCGHTHYEEEGNEGLLKYYQFHAYGLSSGIIELTYDTVTKKITNTTMECVTSSNVNMYINEIDDNIAALIQSYNSECDNEAQVVVANKVSGYFKSSDESVNVMCKALYDTAASEGYDDIVLTYCNTARKYLPYNVWTYENLYESFPFDNVVYIAEVDGSDLLNEVAKYNNVCFNPNFSKQVNRVGYYKVAVIDYLLFHTNSARYYNYFPSFRNVMGTLSNNYRVLLKNWLISNGYNTGKAMEADDYSSSVSMFNRSLLQEA